MNDDLISRKTLLEEIDSLRIELTGISCQKEFRKTVKEVLTCVKHIIDDQPTAFDKENVMVEMKKRSRNFYPSIDHYCLSKKAVDLKTALEIVQKGGIE